MPPVEEATFERNAGHDPAFSQTASNGRLLLSEEDWERVRRELGLSEREVELVRLVFRGEKLASAAREMRVSLGTVKTYSQRVHRKLGVSDQRELVLAVVNAYLQVATN